MDAVADFLAGIMAGGDGFRALCQCIIQKTFEFDFGVAQHIGIGRAAGTVFLQKISKYFVFVLGGKIHNVYVYTDDVGNGHCIQRILLDAAITVVVVVFPVLHKDAAHLCALAAEQGGGYGRIHTARQPHDNILRLHFAFQLSKPPHFSMIGFQAAFRRPLQNPHLWHIFSPCTHRRY